MTHRGSTWCSLRALGPVMRCAIIFRSAGYCTWCGCALTQDTAQIDHVVPRRRGGRSTPANLVAACSDCNLSRPAVRGALSQLEEPLDMWGGLQLALAWYPWMAARKADQAERSRVTRRRTTVAHRDALAAGLGGAAFPFGANDTERSAAA